MYYRPGYSYGACVLIDNMTTHEYIIGNYDIICVVTGEKWRQNTYLVTHIPSSNTIIVDPGDSADLIIKLIWDRGWQVTRILLTHPHHDHVGAAAHVSEHYNILCELHKLDVRLLMHAPMYALRFANKRIPSVQHFKPFEKLSAGAKEPAVRSLHTPGHTRGSVCYVFNGFSMTGDTLLYRHVGRTDLPGSSAEETSKSINKLLQELDEEIVIFPGHGKPWLIGKAVTWWQEVQNMPPEYRTFTDKLGSNNDIHD